MQRLLVFLAILVVSVMSSACINNFAIQELNTKAKEYLDKGDYDEAIKRLESSVDLDGSIYEARYNLAVAYVHKEEFAKAVVQLNEAIKLNAQNPDAYYTLGVALEGLANSKITDEAKNCEESPSGCEDKVSEDNEFSVSFKTADDAKYTIDKLDEAIEAYKKYLNIAGIPEDAEKVNAHIKDLEDDKNSYQKEYEAMMNPLSGDNQNADLN